MNVSSRLGRNTRHNVIRSTAIRIIMVVCALLVGALACNMPVLVQKETIPPTGTIALTQDPPTGTAPPVASETPLPSPSPTVVTPEPLDPLLILDTYPSLAMVRQRLNEMVFTSSTDSGSQLTGRQLLEFILVNRNYNPTESIQVKQELFSELNKYNLPNPGAKIYLINIATGLFAEAHRLYAWSLQDYSPQAIDNLFIQDSTLQRTNANLHRGDLPPGLPGTATHWYPMPDEVAADAHFKQFNLAYQLAQTASTKEEALYAVMTWMMQNFFHAYSPGYGWEVYLDGREPLTSGGPVAYPLSLERIYDERVTGCHQPTVLLEGMLHSLNIPAVRMTIQGHGVLYLPTLERFIHGDHVVGFPDAPPEALLLTTDEIRPLAENQKSIFEAIYPDQYRLPLNTIPLRREGNNLYIHAEKIFKPGTGKCVKLNEEEWARITHQLSAYNLQFDTISCTLSSDKVAILSLEALTALIP